MDGLQQQTLISHVSGGWKIQDQGASRFGACWEPPSWFIGGHKGALWSLFKGINLINVISTLMTQSPPKAPNLLMPLHQGLGFNVQILEEHKHIVCSMSSEFIRVVTCHNSVPLWGTYIYSIICICHILFILSSIEGCLYLLAIVNKAAMYMGVQMPLWVFPFNSYGIVDWIVFPQMYMLNS